MVEAEGFSMPHGASSPEMGFSQSSLKLAMCSVGVQCGRMGWPGSAAEEHISAFVLPAL